MAHMDYHLSAAQFPSGDVVLYITTGGLPLETSSEDTATLWRDIVQCCVYGGFPEAALILKTLPYTRNSLGAFEIKGPQPQRQEIFRLLVDPQESTEHVNLSVSVKFFRTPDHARFSVHHWVGRMWEAEHVIAPPLLLHPAPETCPA